MTAGADDARAGWLQVARAESPRGEVVLRRREHDDGTTALELRVNGVLVMDSRETSTEEALATAALAQLATPRAVLVAGLGLGFTAHTVLADPRVERLVVVEIEEAVVGWLREATVPHGPAYLADERMSIVTADIRQAMTEATPASYDLVLLDVDNGPGQLVYDANAALYRAAFLRTVADALRPEGAVVVWSAAKAPGLQEALASVFGDVTAIPFDVRLGARDDQYWLYLARR